MDVDLYPIKSPTADQSRVFRLHNKIHHFFKRGKDFCCRRAKLRQTHLPLVRAALLTVISLFHAYAISFLPAFATLSSYFSGFAIWGPLLSSQNRDLFIPDASRHILDPSCSSSSSPNLRDFPIMDIFGKRVS